TASSLNQIQRWRHYSISSSAFNSAKMYGAALENQKSVLSFAISDLPNAVSPSYADLGAVYGKLGNYDKAIKAAQFAYETALTIPDEKMKNDKLAYALLHLGNIYKQSQDVSTAVTKFEQCVDLCEKFDFPFYIYQSHKGGLLCYLTLGNQS